jgi:quinate dehydrogenase
MMHIRTVEDAASEEAPAIIVSTVPDIVAKTDVEILAKEIVAKFLQKEANGYVIDMCYYPRPLTGL